MNDLGIPNPAKTETVVTIEKEIIIIMTEGAIGIEIAREILEIEIRIVNLDVIENVRITTLTKNNKR